MQKRFVALAALVLILAGCKSLDQKRDDQLAQVARDWCLTIRASQVLPVYPLTEDLQVGDVFLVSAPLSQEVHDLEQDGFLPLDNVIARVQPTGWQQVYNGAYGVTDNSVVPRQWQFPATQQTAQQTAQPPATAWSVAPGAAFPTYTFQVKRGAGATLAIPIQAVPVGLSLLETDDASGTVNISSASTYGLPIMVLSPQIDAWAAENQNFLKQYAPRYVTGRRGKQELDQHYVRVVYRIYVAGGVNVSLMTNQSRGGRVDAGPSKPITLFDAGDTTNAADAAKNYASMLTSLSQSVASATPGANITIASASSRGVAMNETFPRPLVIGYLAFDRPIEAEGTLGAPLPTEARVSGEPVSGATAEYATDSNADRLRAWLGANDANRATLTDWLSRNAANTSIAVFLNSSQYEVLRGKAVQELGVK